MSKKTENIRYNKVLVYTIPAVAAMGGLLFGFD
jgi:hypothetical protein